MNFRTNRFTLSSLPILTEKSYLRQAARLDRIKDVWNSAQIDLAHPYLNPNSQDCYDRYVTE
ncbi:hypothetical protein [Chamaesiphon minutus]|uniref:hypothetical protein n=1 Tax=Chamaesiphon minutus TaxID=1173032 RepID=UPI00031AAF10|nr:hypothetical protein [Chamaesiphon minutus]